MNIERVREMSPDKKWFLFANNTKGVCFYVVSFFYFYYNKKTNKNCKADYYDTFMISSIYLTLRHHAT